MAWRATDRRLAGDNYFFADHTYRKHVRKAAVLCSLTLGVALLSGFNTQSLRAPGERRLRRYFDILRDIALLRRPLPRQPRSPCLGE